jgi:hypothetical protein
MKKTLLTIAISLLMLSCEKSDKPTAIIRPVAELKWFIDLKNSLTNCDCEVSVVQGTYKDQIVFFIALTDALCDGILYPTLLDYNGKVVRVFTSNDYQEFRDQVKLDTVLYRCKTVLKSATTND